VTGPQWAVIIDTLALPEETLAMRAFIEEDLNVPVRYIINTHYHADHTWGNSFFPGATIIAHSDCRELMLTRGAVALEAARKQNPAFKPVKLVPPHLTFDDGQISLRVGKKNLILSRTPGHSRDGISVLIEEDRVLFAGDAFMPLPYIVDGDLDEMVTTVKRIGKMGLENIVQGHGDIVLRGEIEEMVKGRRPPPQPNGCPAGCRHRFVRQKPRPPGRSGRRPAPPQPARPVQALPERAARRG
jgi:glyoxylase-like metal-dependent hydrolase (beta-lactamase superfamily II)